MTLCALCNIQIQSRVREHSPKSLIKLLDSVFLTVGDPNLDLISTFPYNIQIHQNLLSALCFLSPKSLDSVFYHLNQLALFLITKITFPPLSETSFNFSEFWLINPPEFCPLSMFVCLLFFYQFPRILADHSIFYFSMFVI